MSLVELKTFYDGFEAEIVCGRLRAEGIEAVVLDSGVASSYGGALPVRLMVLAEDKDAAERLLESPATGEVDGGPWSDLPG